jgi:hypothetical protein
MGSDQFASMGLRPMAWYVGIGGISLIVMCGISGFWGSLFAPLPAFFTFCVLRRLKAKMLKPPMFVIAVHLLAVLFLLIATSPFAFPGWKDTASSVILSCIHSAISFWMHAGYLQPILEDMLTVGGAGQADTISAATSRADQSAQVARQSVAATSAGYNMAPLGPPVSASFYAMPLPQYSNQAAPVYYAAPSGAGNANPAGWAPPQQQQGAVGDPTPYGKGGGGIPMATQVM